MDEKEVRDIEYVRFISTFFPTEYIKFLFTTEVYIFDDNTQKGRPLELEKIIRFPRSTKIVTI